MRLSMLGLCAGGLLAGHASAQVIDPVFANDYTITDLGLPPAVPLCLGGITFLNGDNNTLLIGGMANFYMASVFSLPVTRDSNGHINGFASPAFFYAQAYGAPGNGPDVGGIDAGLTYGPTDVLFYCTFEDNKIGELKSTSYIPDRIIDLTALGVAISTGGITFVPPGMPAAGRLKITSWNTGLWYDAQIAPDGAGTYDVLNVSNVPGVNLGPLPESAIHLRAGSPQFTTDSLLVCEYQPGNLSVYDVDSNADPIQATKRNFMTDVDEIEGSVFDPVTGDLILTIFCDNARILVVHGFTLPVLCPADVNHSGAVNVDDLLAVINSWGPCAGCPADIAPAGGNGQVNVDDLLAVINGWGACP